MMEFANLDPLYPRVTKIAKIPLITCACLFLLTTFSPSIKASNTWIPVGELQQPRGNHTSTTLNGNQALVVGGIMDSVILDSAEIFTVSTGQWVLTSSMKTKRQDHVAVLLDDGRVFVAGGEGTNGELASAEIFDPGNAKWTSVASMYSPRTNALVTKLNDGRVLVSSGTNNGVALNTAEIYDPVTNSWITTGAMVWEATHAREALLLNDGRVFIIGLEGWQNALPPTPYDPPNTPTRMPQIYDPGNNSWTAAAPRNVQQRWGTAVVLADGTVLSTGGQRFQTYDFGYPVFTCEVPTEIYDPASNSWTDTRAMITPKGASRSSLLPNGTVLAHGNCSSGDGWLSHLYDPVSGSWSQTGWLNYRHDDGAKSLLADGKVLLSGGRAPSMAELFIPSDAPPPPPATIHVSDLDVLSIGQRNGTWRVNLKITIVNQDGAPAYSAHVMGNWSGGASDADICTTNYYGTCMVSSDYIKNKFSNTTFTVGEVSSSGHDYDPASNSDPDEDSNGTSITVNKP